VADKYEEHDKIYTDGSLKANKVGFAIVRNNQIIKKRMIPQFSIYSAEQQAIITAMENTTWTNKPTIIVTDSLSTLLAVSRNRWTWYPKKRNRRRLKDDSRNQIELIWVPIHVGIGGNEAADQAAQDALNEEIDYQEPYPPQDLMKWMKKEDLMKRQKGWKRGENDLKHRKASVSWQNYTVELSWKEQVVISRLRTGYTRATHRLIKLTYNLWLKRIWCFGDFFTIFGWACKLDWSEMQNYK
jgi:ribonuclease HI